MTVGFKQYWDTLIHLNRLHVEINQFLRKKRLWHTHIMQMRHSFTRNSGTDLIRNELNTDSQSSSWAQSRSINNSVGTLSLRLNVWFMYDKPHKKFSKDRENGFFLLFSQCSLTLSVFYDMLCICLVVSSFFLHPIRPTKYCIMRLTRTHVSLLRFGNIYHVSAIISDWMCTHDHISISTEPRLIYRREVITISTGLPRFTTVQNVTTQNCSSYELSTMTIHFGIVSHKYLDWICSQAVSRRFRIR